MKNLEKQISENIKFVFDNEQSFINEFAGTEQIGMVYSFFMGSAMHYVKFEYGNGGTTSKFIAADKYNEWKESINQ